MTTSRPSRLQCQACAVQILMKHELEPSPRSVELLTKTIMTCRGLQPRAATAKVEGLSTKEKLKRARTYLTRLLTYSESPPPRLDTIRNWTTKLHNTLSHFDSSMWIVITDPKVDILELLQKMRKGFLGYGDLTLLLAAVDAAIGKKGRGGRPLERKTKVIRGGCTVWLRAGRGSSYWWDDPGERLIGPLTAFIRDLLGHCALTIEDAALHSALKLALADLREILA